MPPESISPATITIQAIPIDSLKPVMIWGKLKGITIFVRYLPVENPKALLTFLWSCGMFEAPNAALSNVGHKQQINIMKMLAFGESWKIASPNGNQARGDTGFKICTIGFIIRIAILLLPINRPNGIANKLPKPKPMLTLASELNSLVPMPF